MGYGSRETMLVSQQGSKFERFTDEANILMARDYKGFGNQNMNGVLECLHQQDQ